jgi:hypothetical protein
MGKEPGMLGPTCNPSTREAEAEGSQVQGQRGLCSQILSQNNYNNPKKQKLSFIPDVKVN